MEEGLSFNTALCLIQDHQGFIWIGTRDGLNKYDGVDNIIFKYSLDDSLSLSNNDINCVLEDSGHNIWVGTVNGLNVLNRKTNKFTRYFSGNSDKDISHRYVKCVREDSKGNIWIGTAIGINKYDPKKNTITQFRVQNFDSFSNNIISIFNDRSNQLWFGTKGGLFILNNVNQYVRVTLDEAIEENKHLFEIRDIKQQENGTYWVATEENGVFSFNLKDGRATNVKNYNTSNSSIVSNSVRKILISSTGEIWFVTLDGLSILDVKTRHITNIENSAQNPEGLSKGSFHDILEDSEGGFWIASYRDGVNYFHRQNNLFPHVKRVDGLIYGLNDNSITGFLEDGNKGIWISTGGGGLNYYDYQAQSYTHITQNERSGLSSNNIKSMASDRSGNVWIGTYNGLNYFDRSRRTILKFFHIQDQSNSLLNNQVHDVYVDADGLVWIGTNGGGVQTYNTKLNRFDTVETVNTNINAIFEDDQERIWIGSSQGLECVDRKTRLLDKPDQIANGVWSEIVFVNCIIQDSKDRLLIGTQNKGLFVLDGKEIFWFNRKNGLSSNTVNAVLEDDHGIYWVSSNSGLSRVEILPIENKGLDIRSTDFNVNHGLQASSFYPQSAIKTSNGKLFFGGFNGYNAFYPVNIEKKDYFPNISITNLSVIEDGTSEVLDYSSQLMDNKNPIILDYKQRQTSIKFIGINYVNAKDLYYRYMLTGVNDSWIDLKNQRSINFTYLPIGEHELRLKASSDFNSWGSEYTTIKITVLPPWWKTPLAYTLYIAVIFILLFAYFRYSLLWARLRANLHMEQFQREKEHELHESKLRFFTDISHELRTPLTLIITPLENIISQVGSDSRIRNQLLMMQRNGNRMIQLINQVLDLRKLETGNEQLRVAKGNIAAFVTEICLAFNSIAESKKIDFIVTSVSDDIQFWYDRDKLEIVLYNLLSNAFRHTPNEGKVKLELKLIKSDNLPKELKNDMNCAGIQIAVTDNGPGIAAGAVKNIFKRFYSEQVDLASNQTGIGLELVKRMVELHKGTIRVDTRVETSGEKGFTSFSIYLLEGMNHFDPDEIITDFKTSENLSLYTKDFLLNESHEDLSLFDAETTDSNVKRTGVKQTILIVEDNQEVRKFILELLEPYYNVIEAENGKQGLEKAVHQGPDLMVSDIMMPEMNGLQMCQQIKSDIRTSHIPVILLTARTGLSFKYEGYETGADEYITKPFSANFLKLRIRNLLHQREILRNHVRTKAILEPSNISITSVDEKLLKKAVKYITDNISNTNITVNELSAELGLSRVHFYRKIKALTNQTAIEFIRSVRLRRACVLLEQGKFNIKEVKNLVGFDNADYFRKCFKEEYGTTPSEYAALHNNKSSNRL